MAHEINVALKGKHLFATHPRSIIHRDEAIALAQDFKKRFPASEGYTVDLAYSSGVSERIEVPEPAKPVPVCACCGTTENLHEDLGSGGPYRCDNPGCMVF